MSDTKLLIFPLDLDASKKFLATAKALNIRTIGASSVMCSAEDIDVDEFINLPFITDESFASALDDVINTFSITHIYAPHVGVWSHLHHLQKNRSVRYQFQLCEPSPYVADWHDFELCYIWSDKLLLDKTVESLELGSSVETKPPLSRGQYTSLHKQFVQIPGQCDTDKLIALTHISRVLPKGDLVEIGSLYGRSAFAIAWLAQQHKIGNLISIDPWDNEKTDTQGKKAAILNSNLEPDRDIFDFEKVFWGYIGSVSLLNNVGYIRERSVEAIEYYKNASKAGFLNSPELGKISIGGKISMLHIDGNHRYDHVCKDIAAWEPSVMLGGWILFDDYIWAFGDGPKHAGDELLATGRFDIAFCLGDTLFLRKFK